MLGQFQIALELQSRVLADRMMRCQECAETDTRHQSFSLVRPSAVGKEAPRRNGR
jgi:hypothetical protein